MKKQLVIVIIAVLLITVGLSGCTNSFENIIIDDNYYQNAPRDPFIFDSVKLKEDLFIFKVSYSGGCEEHEFVLISTSFMESNPVQVNIVLSHEDNDDPCEAWITEEMVFNLLPLKKAWQEQYNKISGTIIINLEGWEKQIAYDF